MQSKFNALHANHTQTLVPKTDDMNLASSKWVVKVKTQVDGSIKIYKAYLVAQDFTQQLNLDYNEIFSPVVKSVTIRLILNMALSQDWPLKQLDLSNAFLHYELQEKIYFTQPPGFQDPKYPDNVCHLHRYFVALCKLSKRGM